MIFCYKTGFEIDERINARARARSLQFIDIVVVVDRRILLLLCRECVRESNILRSHKHFNNRFIHNQFRLSSKCFISNLFSVYLTINDRTSSPLEIYFPIYYDIINIIIVRHETIHV